MNLIKKDIQGLKEAKYNPRKKLTPKDKEYQNIKRSIEEFGYVDPIIINKDNTIIGGHQRYTVLKDLGYKEVDVIELDLGKEQEKALNIALNKISGQWDKEKLNDLLIDLDNTGFDITLTGFEELDFNFNIFNDQEDEEEKNNERERTINTYNLDLYNPNRVDGKYQIPIIEKDNYIPKEIIGFNYAKTNKEKNVGVHFYLDDYQFERIWNNPSDYLDILSEYECVFTPDFSLYMDMPMAMKLWNVYRSRLIGQFLQSYGIKVIPTISWAEQDTFEFCFDGILKGSIVSISTIGVKKDSESLNIWKNGVDEMIKKIKPSTILVYGGKIEYDYGNIEVIYFDNKVTENMKNML